MNNNKLSKETLIGILVVAIGIAIWFATKSDDKPAEVKPLTREERISGMFNAWDGTLTPLVDSAKAEMNDPNSFEHLGTTFQDFDKYVFVVMEYTGKNAFGGRVRATMRAKADSIGKVIEIIR